jgi:uncharacterized metal-binding protein
MSAENLQCARCGIKMEERICLNEAGRGPDGCPTRNAEEAIEAAMEEMQRPEVLAFARNASIQEGEGYAGRDAGYDKVRPAKPRIQEIIEFAHRMQYRKLGLAFCVGLRKEAKVVDKLLSGAGFEVVSGCCKMGCNDKELIGLSPDQKIRIGEPEPICNPIAQAYVLNAAATEFNVMVGLCVGHDSLFLKYAEAPCTVLAAKDRLLGHNPLAAIYNIDSYYRALK